MNGSFSMYMAHGGTSFGHWAGADQPFKPDTSSYDYDAPISEAGWVTPKFNAVRASMANYLLPGETLPEPPAQNPVITIPPFELKEIAPVFAHHIKPLRSEQPQNYEAYDFAHGCAIYAATIPAGPSARLECKALHDFGWVFLDGKKIDVMDRRARRYSVTLPPRPADSRLEILVYTMGRVNFGAAVHDRKGIHAPVVLTPQGGAPQILTGWEFYPIPLDGAMPDGFTFTKTAKTTEDAPAFRRGTFELTQVGDTFLDMSVWGKGMVWVNGHSLGRYWNIGPTQTMYVPGPWLQSGRNEVIVLDLLGPSEPVLAGLEEPILDQLRPELDFAKKVQQSVLTIEGVQPVHSGTFAPGPAAQDVRFAMSAQGRQFCLETLSAIDGKPFAAVAEIDLLDGAGQPIPHTVWTIAYVDSEARISEDGSALNAINGQTADFWHTEWSQAQPGHPHRLVIDLGQAATITGFRYTPRPGNDSVGGRIKEYRVYVGDSLAKPTAQ